MSRLGNCKISYSAKNGTTAWAIARVGDFIVSSPCSVDFHSVLIIICKCADGCMCILCLLSHFPTFVLLLLPLFLHHLCIIVIFRFAPKMASQIVQFFTLKLFAFESMPTLIRRSESGVKIQLRETRRKRVIQTAQVVLNGGEGEGEPMVVAHLFDLIANSRPAFRAISPSPLPLPDKSQFALAFRSRQYSALVDGTAMPCSSNNWLCLFMHIPTRHGIVCFWRCRSSRCCPPASSSIVEVGTAKRKEMVAMERVEEITSATTTWLAIVRYCSAGRQLPHRIPV